MNAKKNVEFNIGEIVVYPKHGVGEIMNIENGKCTCQKVSQFSSKC